MTGSVAGKRGVAVTVSHNSVGIQVDGKLKYDDVAGDDVIFQFIPRVLRLSNVSLLISEVLKGIGAGALRGKFEASLDSNTQLRLKAIFEKKLYGVELEYRTRGTVREGRGYYGRHEVHYQPSDRNHLNKKLKSLSENGVDAQQLWDAMPHVQKMVEEAKTLILEKFNEFEDEASNASLRDTFTRQGYNSHSYTSKSGILDFFKDRYGLKVEQHHLVIEPTLVDNALRIPYLDDDSVPREHEASDAGFRSAILSFGLEPYPYLVLYRAKVTKVSWFHKASDEATYIMAYIDGKLILKQADLPVGVSDAQYEMAVTMMVSNHED